MAALRRTFDLGNFDAKAPPTQTPAFLDIVDANRATEDAELADLLEGLGNPPVVTLAHLLKLPCSTTPRSRISSVTVSTAAMWPIVLRQPVTSRCATRAQRTACGRLMVDGKPSTGDATCQRASA